MFAKFLTPLDHCELSALRPETAEPKTPIYVDFWPHYKT